MIKKVSLYAMSLFYVVAGFNHFKNPDFYLKMIPEYLPAPLALNAISGGLEMLFGMMLIRPEMRSISAWCLILLLIAVFPANVSMYMQGGAVYGVPDWLLLARLPLQGVLIAWAYWHTKNPEIDTATIETEIQIATSPEKVWHELTAFQKYPEWNPFIVKATGEGRLNEQMDITIRPPDTADFKFKNTIIESTKPSRLAWKGSFLVRGIFDGTHYFRIEKDGEDSRFVHGEKFSGILVCALSGMLENTRRGFVKMNEALKVRCET